MEHELSKQEIFGLYLNVIFFGQRAYGVAAAAETFFGKSLDQLTVAEAATIAGLPKAPSRYNPIQSHNSPKGGARMCSAACATWVTSMTPPHGGAERTGSGTHARAAV
jgi:membrane peptidoglycan carboxypeptidase